MMFDFVKISALCHQEFEKKKPDVGLDAATLRAFEEKLVLEFLVG